MPYSHLNDYPADVRERAARIRLACFDVDGTLTDGRLFFDSDGVELKAFHVHDGQGLVLLRKAGIAVAFVTARASASPSSARRELGLAGAHRRQGQARLRAGASPRALGIGLDEVAFMGDDLPDLRVMLQVGFRRRAGQRASWVRERVHWRTSARGGHGAARELCDLLLAAQGHAEALLADVHASKARASRATHELARHRHAAAAGRRAAQRLVGVATSATTDAAADRPGRPRSDYVLRRLRTDRARRAGQGILHPARAAPGARSAATKTMDIATPLFLSRPAKDPGRCLGSARQDRLGQRRRATNCACAATSRRDQRRQADGRPDHDARPSELNVFPDDQARTSDRRRSPITQPGSILSGRGLRAESRATKQYTFKSEVKAPLCPAQPAKPACWPIARRCSSLRVAAGAWREVVRPQPADGHRRRRHQRHRSTTAADRAVAAA